MQQYNAVLGGSKNEKRSVFKKIKLMTKRRIRNRIPQSNRRDKVVIRILNVQSFFQIKAEKKLIKRQIRFFF